MTIKQHGGIFGRNPTFNNVTVDNTLIVDQIVEQTAAAGITLDGVTLKDGNVVLADGKGIDFSATSGTGTSELFDDYEEGTFTPTVTSSSGTFTTVSATGAYTLIGRKVFLHGRITITDAGTASGTLNITLPFANIVYDASGSAYEYAAVGFSAAIRVSALASTANLIKYDGTTAIATGNRLSYAIAYNI